MTRLDQGWIGGLLGWVVVITNSAAAGEFNYKPLLTGERAAGLAGAYVAVASDETAMFYNPAGLIQVRDGQRSATVNVVSASNTEYSEVFGDTRWQRESLEIVPGFAGAVFGDSPDHAYGVSLVVLSSSAEDQTDQYQDVDVSGTRFDELRVHNNATARRYLLGFSAAWAVPQRWSVGTALHLDYDDFDRSYTQRLSDDADPSTVEDDRAVLVQVQRESTTLGLRPSLGVLYRGEAWQFGASLTRTFVLSRDYFYAYAASINGFGNNDLTFDLIDDADDTENRPWEVSVGLAHQVTDSTLISLQWDYYSSRRADASDNPALPPRHLSTSPVSNVAVGFEVASSARWTYRGGFYTNFANNDADAAAPFERREEIDAYGVTASLSHDPESAEARPWTVGLQVEAGTGKATLGDVGFPDGTGQAVDARRTALNIFVSTSW